MRYTTFYFSGTGNTKWIAEQFERTIRQKGHQAESYSIDNFDVQPSVDFLAKVKESSCIGFANPIYGANIPPIMSRFIAYLTQCLTDGGIEAKPTYIINTFGYVNAFGPFAAKKLLDKNCFRLMAYTNIRLCNNVSTYKNPSSPISQDKLNSRKKRAEKKLAVLADRLLAAQKYIRGIGPYLLPGIIIRKKIQPAMRNHYRSLSVRQESCCQCMLCVKQCPTGSIRFHNGEFTFSDQCTACMRCYNFCPTASVMIDAVYTDPQKYFRYQGPK